MQNYIVVHHRSCEYIQTHHWHVFPHTDFVLSLKSLSYNTEVSVWQWCFPFFFFVQGFYSILLCCRGSKCKYFMDPLWSFHTDCQGLQSLNSPEIKKRGTGESNHFSTSSLPDLSSLTHAPVWGRKMKTPHPIWQIHMGSERCIQATLTPHCLNAALQHFIFSKLTAHNQKRLTSTLVNRGKFNLQTSS